MEKARKKLIVNAQLQYRQAMVSILTLVISINLFVIAGTFFPIETGLYVNFSLFQYFCIGSLELFLVLVVWFWSIKASHKIAGPAVAFGREMEKLAMGDLTAQVNLRPDDAFQTTAEQINVGITNLRLRISAIKLIAGELENPECVDAAFKINRLNSELQKITTEK